MVNGSETDIGRLLKIGVINKRLRDEPQINFLTLVFTYKARTCIVGILYLYLYFVNNSDLCWWPHEITKRPLVLLYAGQMSAWQDPHQFQSCRARFHLYIYNRFDSDQRYGYLPVFIPEMVSAQYLHMYIIVSLIFLLLAHSSRTFNVFQYSTSTHLLFSTMSWKLFSPFILVMSILFFFILFPAPLPVFLPNPTPLHSLPRSLSMSLSPFPFLARETNTFVHLTPDLLFHSTNNRWQAGLCILGSRGRINNYL